ncbi:MAG: hypothetical protein F9K46_08260, partial [Anaerolineae bacterium]
MSKATTCFPVKGLRAVISLLLTLLMMIVSFGLIIGGYLMIGAMAWGNIGTELSQEEKRMLLWQGWVPCCSGIALLLVIWGYWFYWLIRRDRENRQARKAQQTAEPT